MPGRLAAWSTMRFGLRGRSIALCVLLLLSTVVVLGTGLIWLNYRESMGTLRAHAVIHAHSISRVAEPSVLLNDTEALGMVAAAAGEDAAVRQAEIIHLGGRVLARFRQTADFRPRTPIDPERPITGELTHDSVYLKRSGPQLAVVVPIWTQTRALELDLLEGDGPAPQPADRLIGYVALHFDLGRIHSEFLQGVLSVLAVSVVVIGAGIVATVVTVGQLLRPLRNLADTTRAIAQGDRAKRASESGVGELGDLARSFNHMADRLQRSYAVVERKVAARTAELETRKRELESEIAERLRAEEALREREQRFSDIAENAREWIWEVDAAGRYTYASSVVQEILGYTPEELLGRRFYDTFHAEDQERLRTAAFEAFAARRRFREFLNRNVHRNGQTVWLSTSAVPILGEDGELRGYRGADIDITRRRQAEAELRRAKELAEAASRAKSDFLANMSHEIRTPLTAILGFAENLTDVSLTEAEKLEAAGTIRRNGEHLVQIIDDILDISKIEAGKLRVEQLTCLVSDVVADIESLMRARAREKGLTFDVEYRGPIPERVRTDPTRLRQILANLVGNALKFTQRGSVCMRISLERDEACCGHASDPRLRFDVIDTGVGMSPEQVARVFQPFTQADETMTRRFGGTGLGLTLSENLAEMLGGEITVESTLGHGSTFRLAIPCGPLNGVRMIQPDEGESAALHSQSTPNDVRIDRLECRVLLAEDGPDNQRLISFLLERAGAEVTIVDNGKLAIERVLAAQEEGCPFDVVLMDMQMPVLDGYAATRLLRRRGYTRPVLALTAHAMANDREKCLAAGCDDYASKPLDRHALVAMVRRYAGRRASTPASRSDA